MLECYPICFSCGQERFPILHSPFGHGGGPESVRVNGSAVVALVMLMITGSDLLYGEAISDRITVSSGG